MPNWQDFGIDVRARWAFAKRAPSDTVKCGPSWFFSYYFGHYEKLPGCEFHKYLDNIVYQMAHGHVRENVIGARNLAKSARVVVGGVIYCVALGFRKYAVLASNDDTAQENLSSIVTELETNERLHADFGDSIRPMKDTKKQLVKWSDKRVILNNGAQIRSLTLRQSLRGKRQRENRPDLLILDDPQSEKDLASWDMREQQYDKILSNYLPALEPLHSAAVCLAQIGHRESIPSKLSRNPAWRTTTWPIEVDGHSIWPERFSDEELARMRHELQTQYEQEFLCIALDGRRQVFDSSRFATLPATAIERDEDGRVCAIDNDLIEQSATAVDPSAGFDRTRPARERHGDLDYAAIGTGMVGASGKVYILPVRLIKDNPQVEREFTTRQVTEVVREVRLWRPDRLLVENVAFQRLLTQQIDTALEDAGLPIRPQGKAPEFPKATRIYSTQARIMRGDVVFVGRQPGMLYRQYDEFTVEHAADHDDGPDMVEMLIRALARPKAQFCFGPPEEEIRAHERMSERDGECDEWWS